MDNFLLIKSMSDNRPLMVTIRCLAYNHEPYIRQCLDGFVMQKTNFRFEAVVHDDASTDGTADIIREYAEKYPDIIKPIFERENQYSKRDGSLSRIMNAHMHGKYIAMCEGDDYWTDSYKLQKQVDFMESHSEYTMCFHNATEHFEARKIIDRPFSTIKNKDYTGVEIYKKWIVPTASVLLKKDVLFSKFYQKARNNKDFIYRDIVLFLSCAHQGKVKGMSDCMSVYRRHEGGAVFGKSYKQDLARLNHDLAIYRTFGKQYKSAALKAFAFFSIDRCFMYSLEHKEIKTRYDILWNALRKTPFNSIKRIILYTLKKIIRYNSPEH